MHLAIPDVDRYLRFLTLLYNREILLELLVTGKMVSVKLIYCRQDWKLYLGERGGRQRGRRRRRRHHGVCCGVHGGVELVVVVLDLRHGRRVRRVRQRAASGRG